MAGGHLKSTTVRYTAEIELRPTVGGTILRHDVQHGAGGKGKHIGHNRCDQRSQKHHQRSADRLDNTAQGKLTNE